MGLVKYACGVANRDLGRLTGSGKNPLSDEQVGALLAACREVADGRLADQFPVDVYQTGSGTSSNMNVNESSPPAPSNCWAGTGSRTRGRCTPTTT